MWLSIWLESFTILPSIIQKCSCVSVLASFQYAKSMGRKSPCFAPFHAFSVSDETFQFSGKAKGERHSARYFPNERQYDGEAHSDQNSTASTRKPMLLPSHGLEK